MDRVRATVPLDCPGAEAEALVERFFRMKRTASGPIRLSLRVPLDDFGLPVQLDLARNVDVSVEKCRDQANLNEEYAISWVPTNGGPFPEFSGRLVTWSEEDPKRSYLELIGNYEPPLGPVIGEAFDTALGHLIAQRTARTLLGEIADAVAAMRAVS
jgi:hypothetical protein